MEMYISWYGRRAKFKRRKTIDLCTTCLRRETSVFLFATFLVLLCAVSCSAFCDDLTQLCVHGTCVSDRCICDPGWQGAFCHQCGGRVRLTEPEGYITDGLRNYSVDMQCSWLIQSGRKNATIRLRLQHFETECSWDHLYIFDGDSLFTPLVAAFSGVLVRSNWQLWEVPEVVTHSGSAYLYFYSDAALNMSGFNISYSMDGCPLNCSGHGPCVDSQCTCSAYWTGTGCETPICQGNCNNGDCDSEQHKCTCKIGYKGEDCSVEAGDPMWEVVDPMVGGGAHDVGRALHQMTVVKDSLWIVGGEHFNQGDFASVLRYNFLEKKWDVYDNSPSSMNRFGHSMVVHKDKLYVYGGMLTNGSVMSDLWMFDPVVDAWDSIQPRLGSHDCHPELCSPIPCVGHTANTVKDSMIVIFGHNPIYGYLNTVQQYDFPTGKWKLVQTRGAVVKGGFGHTSIYDKQTQRIYVFGGYHSLYTESSLVDVLYCYNPWESSWRLLMPSQSARYLHSAVILNGLMLVFGGNTHNGTTYHGTDKCFSADLMAYDIAFNSWQRLPFSGPVHHGFARFGHSAVSYHGSVYVFGGFNGMMLKDLLRFSPGDCKKSQSREECESSLPGLKCLWDFENNKCLSFNDSNTLTPYHHSSSRKPVNVTYLCDQLRSCPNCLENTFGCVWCGTTCSHGRCTKRPTTSLLDECDAVESNNCGMLHNCHVCHTEYHCVWQADNKCYAIVRESGNRTENAVLHSDYRARCELPCSSHSTCENCTQGPCMWCSSQHRCVESNAYVAVFPVAQCLEWTTHHYKCPGLTCKDIQSCERCQQNPRCGWCDDGSGTGLGSCMEGSASGPVIRSGSSYFVNSRSCPISRWFFVSCPTCQCNGHSTCVNGTSLCKEPCKNLTEGPNCQRCITGYFGNPMNGGNCTPCVCNRHGTFCNTSTGKCFCITKGIIGHHCDKCDEPNGYIGSPKELDGSCYYNLSIDFQYTFNMSKPEDLHYSQINFMNSPPKPDVDVDFTITCSGNALVNITMASALTAQRILHENRKCGSFKLRFSHNEITFGLENTTFYVYVFSFKTPFVLQISFSQHRTLDLLQFFITFSSCFLSLLIIAAVLWKIKQRYDLFRRRQRLFVEMEQMASRPFAGVALELEKDSDWEYSTLQDGRKKNHPTPVALEPCASGKAAVLTLVVRLSNGGKPYTPAGQSALCMGSALVSLGPTCKVNDDLSKGETKFEALKITNNTSTCI